MTETTHHAKTSPYRLRAQQVAQRVTESRGHEVENLKELTDAVYLALVDEANLELRQILAHLSGQLEMGLMRARRGAPAFDEPRLLGLVESVGRASGLLDAYLDRSAAASLVIRIEPEGFDLGEALGHYLWTRGIADDVTLDIAVHPVLADRAKIVDAVGHLVTRFYFAARRHERVVVQLRNTETGVEGFVGLSPSHVRPESLMEELRLPMDVEDVGIDLAYVRAVLERHGGEFFVASAGDVSAGFGFTLPDGGAAQ